MIEDACRSIDVDGSSGAQTGPTKKPRLPSGAKVEGIEVSD